MEIYIDGKLAALKKGTSFEFVAENRLFSGSDAYSMSITFPLAGCPQNISIFGHINRADIIAEDLIFDCELRDKAFSKFGAVTITQIDETEVKVQFLEGRSEQNFDKTFDNIFINDLDLGEWPKDNPAPAKAWDPSTFDNKCVALPWVNNYSGNIQNLAEYANGSYQWDSKVGSLSWQPYLLYITRKICEAVKYDFDFSAWEKFEQFKYMLICNCLPSAWNEPRFAKALPHWTVAEYFEKLELFLSGEFDIDHRGHRISFSFSDKILSELKPVLIDRLVDDHSVDVKVESDTDCDYLYAKNLVYKECDHNMWKYYSCNWFKDKLASATRYSTMEEFLSKFRENRVWTNKYGNVRGQSYFHDAIHYVEENDTYYIIWFYKRELYSQTNLRNIYTYYGTPIAINSFGGLIVDDADDADKTEVEFVPAWIEFTEEKYGNLLFLNHGTYDEEDGQGYKDKNLREVFRDTFTCAALAAGEKESNSEFLDRIYLGWWNGVNYQAPQLPHPHVENTFVSIDGTRYQRLNFSLRIGDRAVLNSGHVHAVDPKQKSTFKFLADEIPNPRAVFFIRGKRYLCEKITATFTENGMSQLLKGVFYPLAD